MKNKINLYLIEYAINSILRQKSKNFFIIFVFTLLTTMLCSVFFVTNSIKYELDSTVDSLPQIIVQELKAGRHSDINTDNIDGILGITGVEDAVARVWGYYYFEHMDVHFSLVGLDEYEKQYKSSFANIIDNFEFSDDSIVVGAGVRKIMDDSYYKDYFNFIKNDGTLKKMSISGIFHHDTVLESNDVIVMSKSNLRDIFNMPESKATDIVVSVANPEEIVTIASKIKLRFPNTRVITNEDIRVSYQNLFNYKSGLFLALFIISLFTFFIIVYDKASGLSSEQKREIGILKAIGWRVDDVLQEKFYESFIISFFAYILGVSISLFYVYYLQAPIIRDIFVGYSEFKVALELPFIFDLQTLFLVFFLSVPIYIAATIIPSWRVATLEADEVMR